MEITSVKSLKNKYYETHEPGEVPELPAANEVTVLIRHKMGRKAIEFFNQHGTRVVTGASGQGQKVRLVNNGRIVGIIWLD